MNTASPLPEYINPNLINLHKHPQTEYAKILQQLPAAVYTCDKDGYINMYNEAAVKVWGREPEIGVDLWCGSWKIWNTDGVTPVA